MGESRNIAPERMIKIRQKQQMNATHFHVSCWVTMRPSTCNEHTRQSAHHSEWHCLPQTDGQKGEAERTGRNSYTLSSRESKLTDPVPIMQPASTPQGTPGCSDHYSKFTWTVFNSHIQETTCTSCLSVAVLFHWTLQSPVPSILLPFLFHDWIIFHCVYAPHFLYSSFNGPLDWFYILATENSTALNLPVAVSLCRLISSLLGI